MSTKILILFAHPAQERSEVNSPLARAGSALDGVTFVDLYSEYPRFDIDVDREQQRLLDHDVIVFQHPLYWYSTPAILKEWQDLVLEHNFAYGPQGRALNGKVFFCAITAGGPESAYTEHGYNHYTIGQLLRPLEQTATLCHMIYLPPYALFGSRTAADDGRARDHIDDWVATLEALRDDRFDIEAARMLPVLNENLAALIAQEA
jgi:glutathione-regulated potassium-efflux system ancillary protein KefG